MAPTCGGDDSSNTLDAGNGFDASAFDAGKNSETSTPGDGGSEAATGPGAVNGIILDNSYLPDPGVTVVVDGRSTTTDATGAFHFTAVPAKYTLTVIDTQFNSGDSHDIVSLVDLSVRNPTLAMFGPNHNALAGTVLTSTTFSGGDTAAVGIKIGLLLTATSVNTAVFEGTASSPFQQNVGFAAQNGALSTSVEMFAISGDSESILSYGSSPISLVLDGGTANTNVVLTNPALTAITGTYTLPAGYPLETGGGTYGCYVHAPNGTVFYFGSVVGIGSTGTFACQVPLGIGLNVGVAVEGEDENGNQARAGVAVVAGTTSYALTLNAPSFITTPADGDTGVDPRAPIVWSTPTTATTVHCLEIDLDKDTYSICSPEVSSTVVPDLSAYGVVARSGAGGVVSVTGYERVTTDNFVDGTDLGPNLAGDVVSIAYTLQ